MKLKTIYELVESLYLKIEMKIWNKNKFMDRRKKAYLGAKEVERNLRACAQLSCQILYNVLDTEEIEEVYGKHEAYPSLKLF